jgi:hypothetical protein
MSYDDADYQPEEEKWVPFIAALKKGRAILTRDQASDMGKGFVSFERLGYIAVFRIEDVSVKRGHLRFRFTARFADLY